MVKKIGVFITILGLFFVGIPQFNSKAQTNDYNEGFESGNIIQKQVVTINDIIVYDDQHFLGFLSFYDEDIDEYVNWGYMYEWADYMQGMIKDMVIIPTEPGLYYYLPSIDYMDNKPIASIIVKYSYLSIIHMDGTIYEVRRGSSWEFNEIQVAYNDWAYVGDNYRVGYDEGKADGLVEGFDEGYDEGYDEGLELGEDIGYIKGLNETDATGFTALLTTLFTGLGGLLAIELLPNISIGAIIAVPIVFGIIAFVLGRRKE